MEKLKRNLTLLTIALLAVTSMTLTSCNDDSEPNFGEPTIAATLGTVAPGQPVEITVAVAADAGLKSVSVDGNDIESYTDAKTDIFVYEYTGSSKTLVFTVTDKKNQTSDTTITLTPQEVVSANITANTTWTKDKRYVLKGNIYVQSPAELTIEAGTKIFGDKETKGALIVSRGAKIHAVGTETEPIIFTSTAPKGFRNYGDWGGVIILGMAQNNQSQNQTIEGISAPSGDNGKYGGDGTHQADNSGELKYARIEFAGIALSTDNEINGLTLGSVGSGTQLEHIQVSYSGDDSFEWFGGTVNAKYLIAYRGWDDDFDTDFGYSGNVQYGVAFRDPNIADKSSSNGFESDNDGNGDSNTPKTAAKLSNITWFGPHVYSKLTADGKLSKSAASSNYGFGAHIRRNTDLQVYNSVFVGSQQEGVHFDKTGQAAVFKGNYFGRTGIGASTPGTVKKTTPAASNPYDDSNFATDNFLEANQTQVDLSTKFAGLSAAANIDQPSALLANGSSLLTGAVTVPEGLNQTSYIGAFDATNNWAAASWVNYNPNGTDY